MLNEMRRFINLMEQKNVERKIADGNVIVTLDASDPDEVSGSLWFNTKSEAEISTLMDKYHDEINAEFEKFFDANDIDMSMSDFVPSDTEQENGGLIQYFSNEVEQHDED